MAVEEGCMALVEGAYNPELAAGCNLVEVGEGCRRVVDSWLVGEVCSFHIGEEGVVADRREVEEENHSWEEVGHSWFHIEASSGILQADCS